MDRFEEYELRRGPEGATVRTFVSRVLLGATTLLVVAFLFGFPYLERHLHLQALDRKPSEAWGKHLSALCGVSVGREQLYSYVIAADGARRKELLRAMAGINCLDEMGADVQTEAYFLLYADDEARTSGEEVATEHVAPLHLGVALDRAVNVLDRSESGSGAAVRAILWLDLGWDHLTARQRRSFVMPTARHLPHPVAEGLLLRMGAEAVPVLFDALSGDRFAQSSAIAGLSVLEPVLTREQQLEFQVYKSTGLPAGAGEAEAELVRPDPPAAKAPADPEVDGPPAPAEAPAELSAPPEEPATPDASMGEPEPPAPPIEARPPLAPVPADRPEEDSAAPPAEPVAPRPTPPADEVPKSPVRPPAPPAEPSSAVAAPADAGQPGDAGGPAEATPPTEPGGSPAAPKSDAGSSDGSARDEKSAAQPLSRTPATPKAAAEVVPPAPDASASPADSGPPP